MNGVVRPNMKREPLDLFALERQVGGIEPGEFATQPMFRDSMRKWLLRIRRIRAFTRIGLVIGGALVAGLAYAWMP